MSLSLQKGLYQLKKAYEPEGVLGSLTSIVLCFLGVQAGRILTSYKGRHLGIIVRFILWGLSLVSYEATYVPHAQLYTHVD